MKRYMKYPLFRNFLDGLKVHLGFERGEDVGEIERSPLSDTELDLIESTLKRLRRFKTPARAYATGIDYSSYLAFYKRQNFLYERDYSDYGVAYDYADAMVKVPMVVGFGLRKHNGIWGTNTLE